MSAPDPTAQDQTPPLSPEAQALIRRARRSFLFSIGVLLLGFIAIAVVLVYKAARDDTPAPTASTYAAEALHLPQGAEIVSAVAAGGAISVTYRIGPAVQVRVFDESGKLMQQMDIVTD
jgi:hypothetical protein